MTSTDHTTIPRVLQGTAERLGPALALVDGDVEITFAELVERVDEAAAAFMAAGIGLGDRASIWAPNMWEWVVAVLGLQRAGGVLVPLNTRYKGNEAADILGRSGAKVLVTVNGFLGNDYVAMLRDAGVELPGVDRAEPDGPEPSLRKVVVLRGEAPEGTESWEEFLARGNHVSREEVEARAAAVTPDDLSDILFTSGTTGAPKGVMTAHGQNIRAYRSWAELVGLREGDRYLVIPPFFHSFGYKAGILASVIMGATIFPQAVFDAGEVVERMAKDSIALITGPPTLFSGILNHPDLASIDLSAWRLAVTGAAVVPVELVEGLRRDLGLESVITAYGLTEACGVVTACRKEDGAEIIAKTSGRAIPGVEVRAVDESGVPVPAGQPGEIVVRGYNVMLGYFEDPDATAEAIDGEGWLHTGDIGVMDEAGYVQITDRLKDMFIVGGFNAYPAEIEGLMLAHEGLAQVAVVSVPDGRLGEVGAAFVVPRPGATVDPDEVIAWCREQMANYKVPRIVRVVSELPLNASGKVLKFELRERLTEEAGSSS